MSADNDPASPPGSFQTTHWSLIELAADAASAIRRPALEELLQRYYPALRAHLVLRKRLEPHRAEDVLQGFVADKLLERNLVAHADRTQGKFRSLLLRSLENYVADQFRQRKIDNLAPLDWGGESSTAEPAQESVADVFEVAWARQVIAEAMQRMQASCARDFRGWLWPLFEGRILRPTLLDQPPVSYDELISAFHFDSPAQASNALITVKRQFQRILETVVVEYLDETEDLDTELADLRRILSQAGTLDVALEAARPANVASRDLSLVETSSLQLAGIFDVTTEASFQWRPEDMGALLRHQLAAPLRETLSSDERVGRKIPPTTSTAEPRTFADLFQHPAPPLELLNAVKRWSKHSARQTTTSLPTEISTTFYYAALAAALVRLNERITTSDADMLRYGFETMLQQSWLTDDLRKLFEAAS
ncbi:MAG: sigma-70 family RNA polymerase sigma factor [Planctomycetales bacterium]|nr:sigma-70 family RNA polymerase sigma factor [Planctomycetales bacterium]